MTPHQLLAQAERLAKSRVGETQPADYRRAVSAAYYAIFQLLTQDAARRFTSRPVLQPLIARKFDHGQVKQVSIQFAGWKKSPDSPFGLAVPSVPDDLKEVARALQELQSQRHTADYDLRPEADFARAGATRWMSRARTTFEMWERVRTEGAAEAFFLAMLFRDLGNR